MSIIDNVNLIKAKLKAEVDAGNNANAMANALKAVAAIQGGISSAAWHEYMSQYAEDANQLARLKGTDGTLNDPELSMRRAYLVSNAVCAPGTTDRLADQVESIDH